MYKKITAFLLIMMMIFALCACGKSANGSASDSAGMVPDGGFSYGETDEELQSNNSAESMPQENGDERKVILTASLNVETTDFAESETQLSALIKNLEGWIENSNIYSYGDNYHGAEYTIRIPRDNYEKFLGEVGNFCNITNKSQNEEDVSDVYYDTEGRLETQKVKLNRLQELLKKADTMEDIIALEGAIEETEYMIESLSGSLKKYDSLIDYCTIQVYMSEVYKLSNIGSKPDTFGDRLGSAFKYGFEKFIQGLEDLVIWIAGNWLGIIVFAAIIVVAVKFLKKRGMPRITKRKEKTEDKTKNV